MSALPSHAMFEDCLPVLVGGDYVIPSIEDIRFRFIDPATESYEPLNLIFMDVLRRYDLRSFHDWLTTPDTARANAVIRTFFHKDVGCGLVVLNGICKPISLEEAKTNYLVWGCHRNRVDFNCFRKTLGKLNPGRKRGFALVEIFDNWRRAVLNDPRPIREEELDWTPQKIFFRNCLEGSFRSLNGKALEKRAREALTFLASRENWDVCFPNKEAVLVDDMGNEHKIDLLLENDGHLMLVHVKSSNRGANYSKLYFRETHATTEKVLNNTRSETRAISFLTIYIGLGWNRNAIEEESNPLFAGEMTSLSEKEQTAWFIENFRDHPALAPFRGTPGCRQRQIEREVETAPVPDAQMNFLDVIFDSPEA